MKKSLLSHGCFVFLALAISGCGGGGGGSKNPTPTSTTPSTISSSSSLSNSSSSVEATTRLVIQGKAVADALAGGEIVFTAGSQTFNASIDDSLQYNITLDVSKSNSDKSVVAIATGKGANAWVQFASLLPPAQQLLEMAAGDNVLNANEFFGVNLTPLSTAQYAEIKNKNVLPLTGAQRINAALAAPPFRALEGAGLLTRLLNDSAYQLPAQAATTLEFLDTGLYEAYVEIANHDQSDWLNEYVASIEADSAQIFISGKKLSGNYFLETKNNSYYLISFNENGTGLLKTGNLDQQHVDENNENSVTINFTWIQQEKLVTLNFNNPVTYQTLLYGPPETAIFCDNPATIDVYERCKFRFESIKLDLVSEAEFNAIAKVSLIGSAIDGDGSAVFSGVLGKQLAQLTGFTNVATNDARRLVGGEWYTESHSYQFMEDGTVKITDLKANTTVTAQSVFENYHVTTSDTGLWILNTNPAGYDVVQVIGSKVFKTAMFKRSSVVMSDADWVGRWTSTLGTDYFAQEVNADKTWADGFEGEVAGSWKVLNEHRQFAISNGVWRMIRDVLAIHDGKYYMSVCQGIEATLFVPQNCYLSVATRAERFDSHIFWGNWSRPVFNEKNSGDVWTQIYNWEFAGKDLFNLTLDEFTKIAPNKLYYKNKGTIVEMTAASKNEIELCEYNLFQSCTNTGKKVYQKGIQVKLAADVEAVLTYSKSDNTRFVEIYQRNVFMLPKGVEAVVRIYSTRNGYSVQRVSGCDGIIFSGQNYTIPARDTDCELTVEFSPVP